jgi:6-pyruvoyltetrahydropterin/6-carboxytetrahydropterin synthase
VVNRYDHQIVLNESDPMVPRIEEFHPVITTPGDPTSELLAMLIRDAIEAEFSSCGQDIMVNSIRVWESPTCYAELTS